MDARRILGVVTACGLLAWSATAAAQQATGGISGVARDTTGAVMPGVTVEAASPALIKKVRSTVTDEQGRHQITASHVVSNAEVRRSLGRDLAACRGAATCNANVTVELIPPLTQFEDRLHQIDVRLTRSLRAGRTRLRVNFDVYNVFNAGDVLRSTDRYGTSWLNAVQVMGGRLMKIGAHMDF